MVNVGPDGASAGGTTALEPVLPPAIVGARRQIRKKP